MSNSYLCICPDFKTDSNRKEVRPDHLQAAGQSYKDGKLVSAGAMMKEDFKEGEAPQPAGSFMIYKANSIDQARELLMADPYVKGHAWDPSAFQIYPVGLADLSKL